MPRYREVADDLRDRIVAGEFPVGDALPPIAHLMEYYDVPSLNTMAAGRSLTILIVLPVP